MLLSEFVKDRDIRGRMLHQENGVLLPSQFAPEWKPQVLTDDLGRTSYDRKEPYTNLITWVYDGGSYTVTIPFRPYCNQSKNPEVIPGIFCIGMAEVVWSHLHPYCLLACQGHRSASPADSAARHRMSQAASRRRHCPPPPCHLAEEIVSTFLQ